MVNQHISNVQTKNISQQNSSLVTSQFEMRKLKIRVYGELFRLMFQRTGNPFRAFRFIHQIKKKYHSISGSHLLTKAVKVDNRYYWRLGGPGFPSKASAQMHTNEMSRFFPLQSQIGLGTLVFAITKKCLMNCEHCFEWNNLNQKDQLSTSDIIHIVHKYQDFGTTQIMLSGGEPMLRINDIYTILSAARPGTDFWIITSGMGLNMEHAKQLKAEGLTGVMVSIDHYEESKHDHFRGFEGAYNCATQAVINANKAGLVTALSLCATKSFVTIDNLVAYMNLAKVLGVSFVNIIEARAKGRYFGKDVELGKEKIHLLEKIYLENKSSKIFKDYPIINYLGYHQRRVGCFGAGNRFFYIDTDGDAHICPYCSNKVANALDHSAKEIIDLLAQYKCHAFDKSHKL